MKSYSTSIYTIIEEKAPELGTVKLNQRGGFAIVSARKTKYGMDAYKFSNRTQAEKHADKVGGKVINPGRVFYVELKESVDLDEGTILDVSDVDKWIPEIEKGINAPWVSVQKPALGGGEVYLIIKLSLDPEKDWIYDQYQNSRFAMITVNANGVMEMFASSGKVKNMRKTKFKSVKDAVQKINNWIKKVEVS